MKAIDELAKFLHDRYEHHAKENEWDTQTSCKTEFKDLPDANKKTMIAVASDLTALIEEACRERAIAFYKHEKHFPADSKPYDEYAINRYNEFITKKPPKLLCNDTICRLPHENTYRGCDECKYNLTNKPESDE